MPYATPAGKGFPPWMPCAPMPWQPMVPYGWPPPCAAPAEYMSPPRGRPLPGYPPSGPWPYFAGGPRAEDLARMIEPALAGVLPAIDGLLEIPLILLESMAQTEAADRPPEPETGGWHRPGGFAPAEPAP